MARLIRSGVRNELITLAVTFPLVGQLPGTCSVRLWTRHERQPEVAKTIWTDADFDAMGWHDNAVHAIALEPAPSDPGRLLLDIDYIVQRLPPEAPATTLSFWICPATLVFDKAWDLTTDIDLCGWSFQLSLNAIERSGPDEHGYFDWTLAGDNFTIGLRGLVRTAVSANDDLGWVAGRPGVGVTTVTLHGSGGAPPHGSRKVTV